MKIIQVTHGYQPDTGGVQKVTRELAERLARRGHQVQVFTPGPPPRKDVPPIDNLRIHYLTGLTVAHTSIVPSLLLKLWQIHRDSMIHVHIAQAFIPEIVYLVAKLRKIPYVAHFHADVEPTGRLGFLLPWYKRILLRRVLRAAQSVIALSKHQQALLRKQYQLTDKVVVIPNGVNESFFLKDKPLATDQLQLLYVGRLSKNKNVDQLILAVAHIQSKVTLNIVGKGPLEPKLRELISAHNLTNIKLLGPKHGQALIDLYQLADIFLLASSREGLPLVLIEAMAAGIPIIASDVPGNHELVENTGILVNPPTVINFTRAIEGLIKDVNLRQELIQKGRVKANQLRWHRIVQRFEDVYQQVLNNAC